MKLSNIFIVLSLIAGGMSPMALVLGQKKDVKVTKADGTKDLAEIMSTPTCSFSYTSIDNFFFNVPLSEQIFTNTGYFNDHLTDGTYKNAQGQNINIGEGIEINGHTLQYWIDFNPATLSFPRNDGVCVFPLYAGKVFNPVAIEVKANSMNFKVNLEYIPMDSIVLTFKAGVFEGYYNGVTFVLNEDLTFYSSAATSGGPHRVAFAKQDNTTRIKAGSTHIDDKGERTAPNGGKYHRWLMWTNIPFDSDHITQACPADNYRYMYDNLLMNGKPITYYNAWVRGNSKDFTNLSDTSTQNPDYELSHPTGSANTVYDLGIRIEVVTDQPVYVFQFSVPNQLVTDLSLGTLTFGLRDGSSWLSKDEKGNLIVGRLDKTYFENKIIAAYEELENYVVLSDYDPEQQAEIAEIITNAQAEMENIVTEAGLNEVVANAKALIDNVKNAEEMIEQQHIDRVVELINAIPAEIAYTQECSDAINAAMEAYATLTASEIAKFPSESLDKLFNAYVALKALDLANYKTLSKAEINAMVDPNDYRDLEKDTVTTLVNNALAAIDDATTKEEVQQIVNELRALLSAVPTDAELTALELKVAKANAKAELDAIDLSVYRETERAYVEELINNGKIAIDQCLTIEEVEILLNKIKTVIAGVQTDSDLSEVQAALAVKQARERTIIIVSIISSLSLIIGAGLVIFLIRRRKVNQ